MTTEARLCTGEGITAGEESVCAQRKRIPCAGGFAARGASWKRSAERSSMPGRNSATTSHAVEEDSRTDRKRNPCARIGGGFRDHAREERKAVHRRIR